MKLLICVYLKGNFDQNFDHITNDYIIWIKKKSQNKINGSKVMNRNISDLLPHCGGHYSSLSRHNASNLLLENG